MSRLKGIHVTTVIRFALIVEAQDLSMVLRSGKPIVQRANSTLLTNQKRLAT